MDLVTLLCPSEMANPPNRTENIILTDDARYQGVKTLTQAVMPGDEGALVEHVVLVQGDSGPLAQVTVVDVTHLLQHRGREGGGGPAIRPGAAHREGINEGQEANI